MMKSAKTATCRHLNDKGFTMIELLIVAVILGLMASAAAIGYNRFIEKAKKDRAQSDVMMIKKAILAFYTEGGEYPNRKTKLQGTNDWDDRYQLLYTSPAEEENPSISKIMPRMGKTVGQSFKVQQQAMDDIANHLIKSTGRGYSPRDFSWPYIEKLDVDPWGHSYLVNIRNMDIALDERPMDPDQVYTRHHTWVISGGPNGVVETTDISKSDEKPPLPEGDDIAELIE